MQASRSIAGLSTVLLAVAVAAGAAGAQTSAPMTMAPAPATAAPVMTMAPRPGTTETVVPVPAGSAAPVMTMAPRPLPGSGGTVPMPPGSPALGVRALRARRTATGYVLTAQAEVKDGCQAARFDPSLLTIYPPQFNLVQYRCPGSMGVMCMQMVRWVAAQPRTMTSAKPPAFITVHTAAGIQRVPIR